MSTLPVSEETARRIAEALERIAPILERIADIAEDYVRTLYMGDLPPEKGQDPDERYGGEVVYFIRSGGLIKIGTTTNLRERLRTIHLNGPGATLVRAYAGTRELEGRMHETFHGARRHGEWFELLDAEWVLVADKIAGQPPL